MNKSFIQLIFRLNIFIFLSAYCTIVSAKDYKIQDSYYKHLSEVNEQWKNHVDICPEGTISFKSEIDRIQCHLNQVVKHLKAATPMSLSEFQKTNRLNLINALSIYAKNKQFPVNKYHLTRRPYFVDENNVHCAVGYLMAFSGHENLVAAIQTEHNYDYIEDIRTEGVTEWAFEQGFTLDELKWIQPTYAPQTNLEPLSNGTNGQVKKIYNDVYDDRVLFVGEFDSVDLLPCVNIGYYKNDQLSCLGNGIDGIVNDIFTFQNAVYVTGSLEYNSEIYPVAKYENGSWTFLSIPGRLGAVGSTLFYVGSSYKLEVVISHSSNPDWQEIWYLSNTDVWQKKAEVNGVILDIEPSGYGRIYVGNFDITNRFDDGGVIDSTIYANNVVIKSNSDNTWFSIGSEISDTVKAVKLIGASVYFAGTCSYDANSNVCLSRYLNNTLQPILIRNNFDQFGDVSINSLAYQYNSSQLYFGGDFEISPMMGNICQNLASIDLISNYVQSHAILDAPVNSLVFYQNHDLYLGGDFLTNLTTQNLNHLAKITSMANVDELEVQESIQVYPNPINDELKISGANQGDYYEIYNSSGLVLLNGKFNGEKIGGLTHLPKGVYYLKFTSLKGETVLRLIK